MKTTFAHSATNLGELRESRIQTERQWWMGVLAKANTDDIKPLEKFLPLSEDYQVIKRPEIGTIMVEARAGGAGRRFNFGEATMTRCVVQLISGELGFSYSLGRDKAKAEQAALIDALLQTKNPNVNSSIISHIKVIEEKHNTEKELRSRKAAATKVNFFTLVRGEG